MSELTKFFGSQELLLSQVAAGEVIALNDKTMQFGLTLTKTDAMELVATRDGALKDLGRIEIGGGLLTKIIELFCDSPYLMQKNYADTMNELVETFYYIKNDTLDLVGDDELLALMKKFYDSSAGSLEMMTGKLDLYAHNIRFGLPGEDPVPEPIEEDEDNG